MEPPGKFYKNIKMKLLINDKELATFLFSLMDHVESCKQLEINEHHTAVAITEFLDRKNSDKYTPEKDNPKFKDKLIKGISRDLGEYVDRVKSHIHNRKSLYIKIIKANTSFLISQIGEEKILAAYKNSKNQSFVKGAGLKIQPSATFLQRKNYKNYQEDCLFRNMDGNEEMLVTKMNNNWPFWFIDTGYTNFLHGKNKVWHRLVRNNLHHSQMFDMPVDRLGIFEKFPQQWRTSGEKILVIEPGNFSARTFGVDIPTWKKNVEAELKQYTDKPIVFREKLSKKVRKSLYKELQDEDYYCVVNINSNAATEAIWSGIPAITLHRHISNPVTRHSISDINNLLRPNLANWLCLLSYSQFNYDEIVSGKAVDLLNKYHV
jgi:uncharacterized FlaG/YvyC family protein